MKIANLNLKTWGWRAIAVFYATTFLVILILAYTGNLPRQLNQIPYYDKIGHVVLYCIASFLGHRVLNRRHIHLNSLRLPLFPVLFGLFTVSEELVQFLSPNRSLDPVDLIASFAGILLGYWLADRQN
jgi:polysaccharide biosynthesis protein VpsQ